MITLTNGKIQNLSGLVVPSGSMTMTLSGDASIIASPNGFVAGGVPVKFLFDVNGNLSGTVKVWSNAELSPATQYYISFYDADGARINQNALIWQFAQAAGSTVDIGTIVPVSNGTVASVPNAVLTNPVAAQTITGFDLHLVTSSLVVDSAKSVQWGSSGVLTPDAAISRGGVNTIQFGLTGSTPDASGTIKTAVINAVTGFLVNSAAGANTFLKSNGTNYVSGSPVLASADFANQGATTQVLHGNAAGNPSWGQIVSGDLAGSLVLITPNIGAATGTSLTLTSVLPLSLLSGGLTTDVSQTIGRTAADATFAVPGTAGHFASNSDLVPGDLVIRNNSATGRVYVGGLPASGILPLSVDSTGVNVYGSISGATKIQAAATASGTLTLPSATDTLVGKATTDTLTNKTLSSFIGTAKTLNDLRFAENFAGADCGAKINAADADLGATPGEIWVSQAAGTTISTAVSLSANHVLRFIQGGTYTCSAAITLGQGCVILGPGSGGNLTPTILQVATGTNLASLVNMGNQSSILDITLDGNKTNNPTGGVGVKINQVQQVRLTRVLVQNFKSHGVWVTSTLAGDEASVPVLDNCLLFSNDGDGLKASNTTDGFMSKVQFEQNGLGGNPAAAVTVNTSGTTVTWVSGSKWSTDTSLVGTFIRINGSYFLVATIPSTTSLTVTVSPGTLTGVALNWGNGAEMSDSPGWRFEHCDFGGNANNGLLLYGSDAGRGSGQQLVVGNQFGGQRAIDIEELGFGTAAYVAVNNSYTANMFLGSSIRTPNTYSAIRLQDFQDDVIIGNVFRPSNTKYGVEFTESSSGRSQRSVLACNSFIAGFGTAAWAPNTANFGQAIASFANAEGATTSSTFGSGAGSIKFQGGILNSGTGLQHVRASGCTTSAAVNSRCTTTINWPATWNDTNYTATCSVGSVTNPVFVAWTGGLSTTQIQVVLENPPDSAAAATGTVHCIGIHD